MFLEHAKRTKYALQGRAYCSRVQMWRAKLLMSAASKKESIPAFSMIMLHSFIRFAYFKQNHNHQSNGSCLQSHLREEAGFEAVLSQDGLTHGTH